MKKALSVLLSLILLLSLCGFSVPAGSSALMGSPSDALTPDMTDGVVTEIWYERSFIYFEKNMFSYNKGDLDDLHEILTGISEILDCTVKLPGGNEEMAMCSASWNIAELSLDVAGVYKIIATLIPPEGCTFGEGVRTQIIIPVQILDADGPVSLVDIDDWLPDCLAVAVAQGGTVDDIAENDLFQDYATEYLSSTDENGGQHFLDIKWDFSNLNLDVPGVYTIIGTPVAPEGTAFADGLVLPVPTAAISVQAEGRPDINCFYLLVPSICFPWIAPEGNLEEVKVWLSEEDGPWKELTSIEEAYVRQNDVGINLTMLTTGKSYRIQVDYEGGQTGILSITWDDTVIMNGYQEGDRDGGDADGNKPLPPAQPDGGGEDDGDSTESGWNSESIPELKPESASESTPESTPEPIWESVPQSIPELDSMPESEPDKPVTNPSASQTLQSTELPFKEESEKTYSRLSGARLRGMTVGGEAQFSKQGITVTLSAQALEMLSVADDSVFQIEIMRRGDNGFSFAVSVDDIAVTGLADTKIAFPYAMDGEIPVIILKNEVRETVATGSVHQEQQLAVFTVNTTGQFTVEEEAAPVYTAAPSAQNKAATASWFSGGTVCLLALGIGWFLWKRRR